jgi:thioredoxin-like negative regulator of GroEL
VDYTDPDTVQKHNVRNIPTVILMENGQEKSRFVGNKSHSQIINWLNDGGI